MGRLLARAGGDNHEELIGMLTVQPAEIKEIQQLHSEILEATRTNLPKAIRIGELLAGIKVGLEHGQWLPWLAANLPFSARTAARYVTCFENRDRLKLDNVSDLTGAYRLLRAPEEKETGAGKPKAEVATESEPPGRKVEMPPEGRAAFEAMMTLDGLAAGIPKRLHKDLWTMVRDCAENQLEEIVQAKA
jgi:hypothetical protein